MNSGRIPAPVIPVSLFVSSARLLLERHLPLSWIAGELSNVTRAASGHVYFVLKDDRAQVRCVLFRMKAQAVGFELRDGMHVEVRAAPTIYEARGEFQLNVETLRRAGVGVLYEKFLQLKARLEAQGWFASERKRELPAFPRRIGVVTSRHGAALRDVVTTLRRRMPRANVTVYHASVQGEGAAANLAAAIRVANTRAEVDVLIVCRGGGSLEDLWAFNEEVLARAVLESRLVIVSGVGHETDFTICDFVADVRAATPTAAACAVVPERLTVLKELGTVIARFRRAAHRALEWRMQRIDLTAPRLIHPSARIARRRSVLEALAQRLTRAAHAALNQRVRRVAGAQAMLGRRLARPPAQRAALERLERGLRRCMRQRLLQRNHGLQALAGNLRHLSPNEVLERGYSIVLRPDGSVVDNAGMLTRGEKVELRFARGAATAKISDIDPLL